MSIEFVSVKIPPQNSGPQMGSNKLVTTQMVVLLVAGACWVEPVA